MIHHQRATIKMVFFDEGELIDYCFGWFVLLVLIADPIYRNELTDRRRPC